MKLKEYLKEKKEHRNSESFFCHKENSASFKIAIFFLGIPSIIVYLSLENGDFNFDFLLIFSIIFFVQKSISQFYLLIFEYPAFLYITDSQLVVWDNFFKKRSIEKNQIKKAYVFDDRHDSSTKLKNALRLELNDGNFFDVCLDYAERKKNEATAMVIISALRCPYESEYEQKTITKLDDEEKTKLDDEEKTKLDDEEKEILKKKEKQNFLTLIIQIILTLIIVVSVYLYFDEETMDNVIYALLFSFLLAFLFYFLIGGDNLKEYESEYEQKTITKLDDEEKEILKKKDDEDKEILKKGKKLKTSICIFACVYIVYYEILVSFQLDEETMNYAMYAPPFAFFIYALFKYCRI
jgi:ABC-type multidrug transport system fused ATPase/permease subunit